jgi:Type I phosphodiesterase / nucleotide pyrophosphatase
VSFSSNDSIGHCWGPDSQEVLDSTLRTDVVLGQLLRYLDEKVGKDQYLLALTADHGICPIPEVAARRGLDAKRVPLRTILASAEEFLSKEYPHPTATKTKWIESTMFPWIYLNERLITQRGLRMEEVAGKLAGYLETQPGIFRTYTRERLALPADPYDDVTKRMKRSFHPDRAGDIGVVLKPYHLPGTTTTPATVPTGTTHGSPFAYDTHVPLLIFGQGVKAAVRKDGVTPQAIAAIFATGAGLPMPRDADFACPEGVFIRR